MSELAPFGGSGILQDAYDRICELAAPGSAVLEFGSGPVSTPRLAERYRLTSVEHDLAFVGAWPGSDYVHAPLVGDGWYDPAALARELPLRPPPALILIDGPIGSGARTRILRHLEFVDPAAVLVVDDVWRLPERAMAVRLGRLLGRSVEWHPSFAVVL